MLASAFASLFVVCIILSSQWHRELTLLSNYLKRVDQHTMGVDEFRTEISAIKESFDDGLISDKEIYAKMCVDAQRRNLPNLACSSSDHPPLSITGVKRLLWPVFVTVSILGLLLLCVVGFLYRSLSSEMSHKMSKNVQIDLIDQIVPLDHIVDAESLLTTVTASNITRTDNSTSLIRENRGNHEYVVVTQPLYYLSTSDGILSHFFQLQHLWSITHDLKRSLVPISFHSPGHHIDVEWINMCEIFEFPSDIDCSLHLNAMKRGDRDHLTPSRIISALNCTILGAYPWALEPKIYGLPPLFKTNHKFDFRSGECVAGFVDHRSGFAMPHGTRHSSSTFLNISFTGNYVQKVKEAKISLGLNENDEYSVVHWLFDDATKRTKECDERSSIKDQCISHLQFIKNIKKDMSNFNAQKVIYVITTEKNITILNDFTDAGFSLLSNITLTGNSSSVDNAVIELGLLVDSNHRIFRGQGFYKTFADIIVSQNLKQFRGP